MRVNALISCCLLTLCSLTQAFGTETWSFQQLSASKVWKNQPVPTGWEGLEREDRPNTLKAMPKQGILLNGMIQSELITMPANSNQVKITLKTGPVNGCLKLYLFQYRHPNETYFKQCGQAFDLKQAKAGTYTTSLKVGMQGQKYLRFALDGQDAIIQSIAWKALKQKQNKIVSGRITIPCHANPPIMDNVYRPEQWKHTFAITNPFISLSRKATILNQEEIRLQSDGKNLYISLKMSSEPIARITQKDGDVYKDDSLELIVQPKPNINRIFHLAINAKGVVFDEERAVGQSFLNWNCPGLKTAFQRSGNAAYLAIAIPFDSLSISPSDGWLFNLCRNYARPHDFSAMNQGGYFKNLIRANLSTKLTHLHVSTDKQDGRFQFQATVGNDDKTRMTVTESGGNGFVQEHPLENGTAFLTVPSDSLTERTFRLAVRQDDQELYVGDCLFSTIPQPQTASLPKHTKLNYYPLQKKVAVTLQELTFSEQAAIGPVICTIAGKKITMPALTHLSSRSFTQCDCPIVQSGTLPWSLTVYRKDGSVFETNKGTIQVSTYFPWLNNDLGKNPIVIPPFTPLQRKKNTVACARRNYLLADNGFPASIVAANKEVLNAPIALRTVRQDNTQDEIRGEKITFTTTQDHRVEFNANLKAKGLTGNLSAWMEYDGLIYYTLTLTPKRPLALKKLFLDIPFNTADFFHVTGPSFRSNNLFWYTREMPGEGVIWKSTSLPPTTNVYGNFIPSLWLGSFQNGLSFFAESDRGWINKRRTPVYQLVRNKDKISLHVNLIACKAILEHPMTVQFGLIATPLKPRTVTGADQAVNWETSFARTFFNTGFHLRDPFISRLMLNPKDKASYVVYSAGQEYVQGDPDFKTFAVECDKDWTPAYNPWETSMVQRRNGGMDYEDYTSRQVIWNQWRVDFMIWKLNKLLTQTPVDGIYLDNSYATFSQNALIKNGGFKREDGVWQGRCNILMQREYIKRAAVLAYQNNKRFPRIVIHNTGAMIPASFAFGDCFFDGEMDVTDYYRTFPRNWNEIMLGVDWGLVPGRLSMIRKQKNDQTRPLLSIFKLYDMKLWHTHNGLDNQLYGRLRQLEADFGTSSADTRFYGYWNPENPVKLEDNKDMLASCFQRKNKLLVYVSNPTSQDGHTTLRLPQPFHCMDALTQETIEPTLTIKSHDFKSLIITFTKEKP